MKLFIFRIPFTLEFLRVEAVNPMLAIRELVRQHGQRPYDLVAITESIQAS